MKRTALWWSTLSKKERIELVNLEKNEKYSGRSSYIPDDCSECGNCGTPHLGSGLCPLCSNELSRIIRKANSECDKQIRLNKARHEGYISG